jgi:hypothetical protein
MGPRSLEPLPWVSHSLNMGSCRVRDEEDRSHTLRCEGNMWRIICILDKRFANIDVETDI